MINLNPPGCSPQNIHSPRPFQKRKCDIFKGFNIIIGASWETIKNLAAKTKVFSSALFDSLAGKTQQISNSLAGKVVKCAVAESAGAYVGEKVAKSICSHITARIGQSIAPILGLGGAIVGGSYAIYSLAAKTSDATRFHFTVVAATSVTLLLTFSFDQLSDFGGSAGQILGDNFGSIAGTILAGYQGLSSAGSKATLWDSHNPWDSYSISMLRYLGTGALFDTCINSPSTPCAKIIIGLPRLITRTLLQTLAFSSNAFIPFIKSTFQARRLSKNTFTPLVVEIITTRFHGTKHSPSIKKEMAQKFVSTFDVLPSLVEKGLKVCVENGIGLLIDNTHQYLTIALRSFHQYTQTLNTSDAVRTAHNEFRESYLDSDLQRETCKAKLLNAIKAEVQQHPGYTEQLFQATIELFLNNIDIKELSNKIISKIQELEVEVIGLSLLAEKQAPYLKDIIEIYLFHYLVFTLSNYKKLTAELTPSEEQDILLDANNFVLFTYLDFVTPQFVASAIHQIAALAIKSTFKTKDLISTLMQQPEQMSFISHLNGPLITITNEEKFPDSGLPMAVAGEDLAQSLNNALQNIDSMDEVKQIDRPSPRAANLFNGGMFIFAPENAALIASRQDTNDSKTQETSVNGFGALIIDDNHFDSLAEVRPAASEPSLITSQQTLSKR